MAKLVLLLGVVTLIGIAVAGRNYGHGTYSQGYVRRGYTNWGDWSHWGACSKYCGGGYQTRSRVCNRPSYSSGSCYGDSQQRRECNTHHCQVSVDGGWSEWGYYGDCSKQCGTGYKSRSRTCTNPAPSYGGADCYGSSTQTVSCYGNGAHCKVNGGWSEWGYYGQCSKQCGGGYKSRSRTCTNPAPSYGGADCYGSSKQTVSCNTQYCKVNGGWSNWGYYGDCSKQCGYGYKSRSRTCTNPAPSYGGADCYGSATETAACHGTHCKVNGGWSEWGYYGQCSKQCGGGYKSRSRSCTNPAPSYGGADCYGSATETVSCNTQYCKVNGGWSNWGYYGDCSKQCGYGYKSRSRTCTNPAPSYGGADCYGSATETAACHGTHCKVNGGWSEWGYYGDCSKQCGTGYKSRSRTCTNPAPSYGGNDCYGSSTQTVSCYGNGAHCKVNGGWSDWGYYGDCSKQCGTGYKSRSRTCTNPAPSYGGNDCYGSSTQTASCYGNHCSVDGGWSSWGYYGHCSVTCGTGYKSRSRTCTNPAPGYNGRTCYGSNTQTISCNAGACRGGYY